MISIATGSSPSRTIVGDRVAGGCERVVDGERGVRRLGERDEAQRDLQRDAEQALRAAEHPGPVRAHGLGAVAARARTTSPSGSTASIPSTWLLVIPCLRQCAPPELKARLPPIVQTDWLDGSGA